MNEVRDAIAVSSMSQPLVSIITATYNMARFLPATIESCLGQTYLNIQYIIVNDGSNDDTKDVIKPYERDPRLMVIDQENTGQSSARNKGLAAAKGKYVCFLDGDDVWDPNKVQAQVSAFEMLPLSVGVIHTREHLIDETGTVIESHPPRQCKSGSITAELFINNFVGFSTAMIRRPCIEKIGGFDESQERSDDFDLWLRLSTESEFLYLDLPTTFYRVWTGQISTHGEKRFEAALRIMDKFVVNFPEALTVLEVKQGYCRTFANLSRYYSNNGKHLKGFYWAVKAAIALPYKLESWRAIVRAILVPFRRVAPR
jgi:glycosyltransferase involved in cell wall biosynthesis